MLLEKAKQIVKENKRKSLSDMEKLLTDKEVIKTARYLVKHMSQSAAREKLNEILEEAGRLPKTKAGKTVKITLQRFKTLLPKQNRKRTEA